MSSIDSNKSATSLKKLPNTIVYSIVFLAVLSIGVIAGLLALSKSQDLRRDASTDLQAALTQPFTCGWCGTECAPASAGQVCATVLPPEGQSCVIGVDGGTCVIVNDPQPTCTPRLPCMDPAPGEQACEPQVTEDTWFCPKPDPTATPTPTKQPTPTATPTPTTQPTPTATPKPIVCDWCGTECAPVNEGQMCATVVPPSGFVCSTSTDGNSCIKTAIQCVPKPACMFEDPACMIKLAPNTVFCADSDLNHDNKVDSKDLDLLYMHFFDNSPADLQYDINHDQKIDIFDYSVMVKEWTR